MRRAFALAVASNRNPKIPVDELIERKRENQLSRREFLKGSTLGALTIGSGSLFSSCTTAQQGAKDLVPRVVIVGAGVAGLNAAYKMKLAGLRAKIYESSKRTGGRIYTAKDILASGLTTELGGEFIDSNHQEMLALAKEFELELIDVQSATEADLVREAYFFNGSHHAEAQVIEAFRPLAERLKADTDKLGEVVDYEHTGSGKKLDNTPLSLYLDQVGASGWLRKLLEVAFVTEYGLETYEQSALNLLFMISTDLNKFELFGESDERFKVKGGNQRVVDELAKRLENQIHPEHRLIALRNKGKGYLLNFANESGSTVDVEADFVVLALPFSLLRDVDLRVDLPKLKRKAIHELGYGSNAKLMLGFNQRPWREQKHSGNIFSDEPFQLAWDNSRLQAGVSGGLTLYSGGRSAVTVGEATPDFQAKRMLPGVEKAFPGITSQHNGKVERFHWPTFPWTKGSYSCYKPGQWTSIAGSEFKPVGNLFFAGEHCSSDFQGFMNGGAETGKAAAELLLGMLKKSRVYRRSFGNIS